MRSLFIFASILASLFSAQYSEASFQPNLFCKKFETKLNNSPQRVRNKASLTTLNVTTNTDNNPGGMGEIGDLRFAINTMN